MWLLCGPPLPLGTPTPRRGVYPPPEGGRTIKKETFTCPRGLRPLDPRPPFGGEKKKDVDVTPPLKAPPL